MTIDDAVKEGARQSKACEMVGITPRTLQNWRKTGIIDRRKGAAKRVNRKLSGDEREKIVALCTNERFKDMNPHEIVAVLASEGTYLASDPICQHS